MPSKEKTSSLKIYYFLIAAVSFLVYLNSLSNDFVFDDESVVLSDPTITSLSNIPKYFTAQEGFHKVIGRYYRPVVSSSYAIDYSLWKFKPFGFHLTNVLIHLINSVLFLYLLFMIFGVDNSKQNKNRSLIVFLAGLIFAVHPIHTEAVSWVSGRTDSLAFTFFVLAFIIYLKYKIQRTLSLLILLGLTYALALLSKEMAVTFPVVIILYDLFTEGGIKATIKKHFKTYGFLIFLSVLYLFFRWLILKDVPERESYNYLFGKSLTVDIATMLQSLPVYFNLLFFPVGLLYHYNGYLPYQDSFLNLKVILSIIFICVTLFLAFYLHKKLKLVSLSILLFFITLLPVMNIIPTVNFMAERFLYITSVVPVFIIAEISLKYLNKKNFQVITIILILICAAYSYLTVLRNFDWKTNDALFLSADGKPGTVTYVNIGNIYANRQQIDSAEVLYRKAISLREESLLANNNLGKVFLIRGNFDSAFYYMNKARLLDTLSPEPLFSLSQLCVKFGKTLEAMGYLQQIKSILPNGYMNSNAILDELKKSPPPVEETQNQNPVAQKLEKSSFENYRNKKFMEAISDLEKLIELNPTGKKGYYNNIGMCYLEMNDLGQAKKYFSKAVESDQKFSVAYNNLGTVYARMGDTLKARESYKLAIQADSNNSDAVQNLLKLK